MMTIGEFQLFPDAPSLFSAAAEAISTALETALEVADQATLVLTGGNTPRPVYELLAESPYRERIHWDKVDFFWGDERCVSPDHPESNYRMAREALLSHISVPESRIHRILAELEDHQKAALRYEAEIRRLMPEQPIPRFDLILLGMGEDGHTASLFPGSSWDETRLVVANFVPKLQSTRITMTPRILNEARHVIFLTAGTGKAAALRGVLEDPQSDYPAKRIRPVSGSITWMVDAAAASLLTDER